MTAQPLTDQDKLCADGTTHRPHPWTGADGSDYHCPGDDPMATQPLTPEEYRRILADRCMRLMDTVAALSAELDEYRHDYTTRYGSKPCVRLGERGVCGAPATATVHRTSRVIAHEIDTAWRAAQEKKAGA